MTALQWLELLDSKDYENSWSEAGRLFKSSHTISGWTHEMGAVRDPLGFMYARSWISIGFARSDQAPGLPAGHYAIVRVPATFFGTKTMHHVTETVTVDEEDGHWKVVGYSIE